VHNDPCLVERLFNRLSAFEDLGDFLERAAPRFDEEEVDEDKFKNVPEDEEEVVL
jgi:hypothetical protein